MVCSHNERKTELVDVVRVCFLVRSAVHRDITDFFSHIIFENKSEVVFVLCRYEINGSQQYAFDKPMHGLPNITRIDSNFPHEKLCSRKTNFSKILLENQLYSRQCLI